MLITVHYNLGYFVKLVYEEQLGLTHLHAGTCMFTCFLFVSPLYLLTIHLLKQSLKC